MAASAAAPPPRVRDTCCICLEPLMDPKDCGDAQEILKKHCTFEAPIQQALLQSVRHNALLARCGHRFHLFCATKAISHALCNQAHFSCPLCRAVLLTKNSASAILWREEAACISLNAAAQIHEVGANQRLLGEADSTDAQFDRDVDERLRGVEIAIPLPLQDLMCVSKTFCV